MDSLKVTATISASVSIKDNKSGEEVTQMATEELLKTIIDWLENDITPIIEFKYEMPSEYFNDFDANKLVN
jgi:hypothetical protein